MNKKTTLLSLFALVVGFTANAQFTETMGTASPTTDPIANREAGNRFDITAMVYAGTGDVRNTLPSTGYAMNPGTASGGYNVLLQQPQETFILKTINASGCSISDSISFGILKTTTASAGSPDLKLQYSLDNGVNWIDISYPALPTGTGTANKWYRRSASVPSGALVANLQLRFINTLNGSSSANPQFRIDDVEMSCGSIVDCSTYTAETEAVGNNVFCEGSGATVDIEVTTNAGGSATYQWYEGSTSNPISGATAATLSGIETEGTYFAIISTTEGCELTSTRTYVKVYPVPALCVQEIEDCEAERVNFCPSVKTTDLIFSEYVEGSNFNKYLEIYNGTCIPVEIADYKVRLYTNGASTAAGTDIISLPSYTLMPGDVYVIANEDADDISMADFVTGNLDFNGDDAVELWNDAATFRADLIGAIGFDPGSNWRDTVTMPTPSPTLGWRTENKTLVRKDCVYSGIVTNPALPGIYGFPTLFTEWDTLPQNDISGLGSHTPSFTYTFGGSATIISSTSTCAEVSIVDGTVLEVTPVGLCTFNDCTPVEVPVTAATEGCDEERRSAVEGAKVLKAEVFPNPFQDKTAIAIELAQDGEVVLTITSLSGQVVLTQTFNGVAGKQRFELNLAGLSNGAYVCNIASANGMETVRIVKSK
jgi:hypothetical protein